MRAPARRPADRAPPPPRERSAAPACRRRRGCRRADPAAPRGARLGCRRRRRGRDGSVAHGVAARRRHGDFGARPAAPCSPRGAGFRRSRLDRRLGGSVGSTPRLRRRAARDASGARRFGSAIRPALDLRRRDSATLARLRRRSARRPARRPVRRSAGVCLVAPRSVSTRAGAASAPTRRSAAARRTRLELLLDLGRDRHVRRVEAWRALTRPRNSPSPPTASASAGSASAGSGGGNGCSASRHLLERPAVSAISGRPPARWMPHSVWLARTISADGSCRGSNCSSESSCVQRREMASRLVDEDRIEIRRHRDFADRDDVGRRRRAVVRPSRRRASRRPAQTR